MNFFRRVGFFTGAIFLIATPSSAEVVQYMGSLMIGFGDSGNPTDVSNNAVPICAHTGPNPFAAQTFGSLPVFGHAEQTLAGGLTFSGHGRGNGPQAGSGNGGVEIKYASTCRVAFPPFLNHRVRSRTQRGSARWPSLLGPFAGSGTTATPATPATTPTYMIGPGQGNEFIGTALVTPIPFLNGQAAVSITKGVSTFGGPIPYQGGGGVQFGRNTYPGTGSTMATKFGDYDYVNGFLPVGPRLIGTGAKGKLLSTTSARVALFPNGAWISKTATLALRTPGGTTINQQGAIQTLMGGNTATQSCPPPTPCVGTKLITPVLHEGAYFEWTTGRVRHTDRVGDFVTMRSATGFDNTAPATSTTLIGTTRKLQLVSPWSASIKPVGFFGFPLPDQGFGGVAVLTLNILPAPEPASAAMLGTGIAALLGLGGLTRRR